MATRSISYSVVETSPDKRFMRLDHEIGRGSYKKIYLALWRDKCLEVAWSRIEGVDNLTPSLMREIDVMTKVQNDFVVKLHHWWYDDKKMVLNMVMELFVPGSLRNYIAKYHPIPARAIKWWAQCVINGIESLHKNNILHRDLKCANVLINSNTGVVKIVDFGLSRVRTMASAGTKSVVGTPEYMAPELFDGQYGDGVDVYSYGLLLLEMATNKVPYEECKNLGHMYKTKMELRLPLVVAELLSGDFKRLVLSCLLPVESRISVEDIKKHPFFENEQVDEFLIRVPDSALTKDDPKDLRDKGLQDVRQNFAFLRR